MWNPKPNPPPPTAATPQSSPSSLPSSSSSSSWLASNERVSIDTVSNEIRIQAETKLVKDLMNIVQLTKKRFLQKYGGGGSGSGGGGRSTGNKSDGTVLLTHTEQDVFSRYTYYGYRYGIMAGMTSFIVLYGGFRYYAYRRYYLQEYYYVPKVSEQYHSTMKSKQQQYHRLDRPSSQHKPPPSQLGVSHSSKASTTTTTSSSSPTAPTTVPTTSISTTQIKPTVTLFSTSANTTFAIFPNDAIVTIQMYMCAAISILVSTMTWNYLFDWDQLHEDISNLPLQSGPSMYCQASLCPEFLYRHQQIQQGNLYIPITTIVQNSTSSIIQPTTTTSTSSTDETTNTNHSDNNSDTDTDEEDDTAPTVKIVQLSTKELWEDPITENLHRMKRLYVHCEQRRLYEEECRKRQVRLVHPHPQMQHVLLADVPEPALPLRYHSIPSSKNHNNDNNHNNTTTNSNTSTKDSSISTTASSSAK